MAVNGHAKEPFPGQADTPLSTEQKGFKISTQKLPILKAGPIDDMTERLGINLPEMIFGDNYVSIEHVATGWSINFNAFDALDRVDKTGKAMLQVAHSTEWQRSRLVYTSRATRKSLDQRLLGNTTMKESKRS